MSTTWERVGKTRVPEDVAEGDATESQMMTSGGAGVDWEHVGNIRGPGPTPEQVAAAVEEYVDDDILDLTTLFENGLLG